MRVKNGDKTLKWTFEASVIFIQENAAFIQVLNYQDWQYHLLNTKITVILRPVYTGDFCSGNLMQFLSHV